MRTKSIRYTAAQDESLMIQSPTGGKSGISFFETCKGKRRSDYFHNNNPIVLELACGRGEYTVGLSHIYPEKNFIGIDIKGERMMQGITSRKSKVENDQFDEIGENSTLNTYNSEVPNVAFLRTIIHHLDQFFAPEEVNEIWIVHPDPRSKGHDERRRLTSPRFLRIYYQILKSGGLLRLKTDDDGLFDYSIESLDLRSDLDSGARMIKELPRCTTQSGHFVLKDSTHDLYNSPLLVDHHGIRTHYEEIFVEQGKTIKYGIWSKK